MCRKQSSSLTPKKSAHVRHKKGNKRREAGNGVDARYVNVQLATVASLDQRNNRSRSEWSPQQPVEARLGKRNQMPRTRVEGKHQSPVDAELGGVNVKISASPLSCPLRRFTVAAEHIIVMVHGHEKHVSYPRSNVPRGQRDKQDRSALVTQRRGSEREKLC